MTTMKTHQFGLRQLTTDSFCVLGRTATHHCSQLRGEARENFKTLRINGTRDIDSPRRDFPVFVYPRDFVWTKGNTRADGSLYGVRQPDGYYAYELRYNPAPDVIEWVEDMDLNYIRRLAAAGELLKHEDHLDKDLATYKGHDDKPRKHKHQDEILRLFHDAQQKADQS